jgi:hypothetical protein
MLILSAVPCCATDNCNDKTEQSPSDKNHKHNDDCKNCSPFALCGNCTGFTINAFPFVVDAPVWQIEKNFTGYITSYFPPYFSSFWQPPKLG